MNGILVLISEETYTILELIQSGKILFKRIDTPKLLEDKAVEAAPRVRNKARKKQYFQRYPAGSIHHITLGSRPPSIGTKARAMYDCIREDFTGAGGLLNRQQIEHKLIERFGLKKSGVSARVSQFLNRGIFIAHME